MVIQTVQSIQLTDYVMANEETWFTFLQDFSVVCSIQSSWGLKQPPVRWAPGTLLPRVNQSRYKAHNSPPSGAEIMSVCHFTLTPPCLYGMVFN